MRIVVGADDSDGSATALRWAAREHRLHGGTITAVHAWSWVDAQPAATADGTTPGFDPTFGERKALDQLVATVRAVLGPEAVDVDVRAVEDHPASALVAAGSDADLLVVGARGLGGFRGLLLGSTSHRVAHEAHVPVAVVRPPRTSRPSRVERIIVGFDGSPTSHAALHWAAVEGAARDALVDVVHAWTVPSLAGPLTPAPVVRSAEEAARDLVGAGTDRERRECPEADLRPCPIEGRPARTLLEQAGDAELLVVGSRGYGTLGRMVLGSVSSQVLTHAPCTVVVVPPAG